MPFLLRGCAAATLLTCGLTADATSQNAPPTRRLTIGVLPFIDATGGTAGEVGIAVGRLVQSEMIRQQRVQGRVVAPEGPQPESVDPERAAAIGREYNAPVMLIGTVVEGKVEESNKGGWIPAIRGQAARVDVRAAKARVTLQGDLVASANGQVLASLRATSDFTDRQFGGTLYSSIGSWESWDGFIASPMGKALRQAVQDLVKQIDTRAPTLLEALNQTAATPANVAEQKPEPHGGRANRRPTATQATLAPERRAAAAPEHTGSVNIPLRKGLTIVTAVYREDLGDYESTKVITAVSPTQVSFGFAGQQVRLTRTVLRSDLDTARLLRAGFNNDDLVSYPGTTALGTSTRVLRELLEKGAARIGLQVGDGGPRYGTVKRLAEAGSYSALVNDVRVDLPVVRASGMIDGEPASVVFLNDPENPLVLQFRFDDRTLDVIRIAYPNAEPDGSRIANALRNNESVDIYGIYFDFGSDRIRPESDPVLQEIAAVLRKNPNWSLTVAGHTDNVGSDRENQELSERRAAAVKRALVERYRVRADRLQTAGFGESRPKESNETLQGRARNRRVELSRR